MHRTSPVRCACPALVLAGSFGLATVARAVLPSPAPVLVSTNVPGTGSGNQRSGLADRVDLPRRVVSQDGRYVVFTSFATNLVATPDPNNNLDVFVRDLQTGTTQLVSVNQSGTAAGNGFSNNPTISADGRYVCFESAATDLAPGDTNGGLDVYVRDLQTRITTLVSANPAGNSQSGFSRNATMTPDGHFVAFTSTAADLVAGYQSAGGTRALFLRDLRAPPNTATQLVSTLTGNTTLGVEVSDDPPDLSADGRFVVFTCNDSLVPADQNGTQDVYLRDTQLRVTELVSANPAGGSGNSSSFAPAISADGRFVAFNSAAADLVAGIADTNGSSDVFLRDRTSRTTKLVSINAAGTAAGNGFTFQSTPSISTDGRYVAFTSRATDLTPGVSGTHLNAYVRDTVNGSTALASVNQAGTAAGNGDTNPPTLSSDGHFVVFASTSSDLVGADTNGKQDVFRRDLFAGKTALVSRNAAGTDSGNGASGANGRATLSGDGTVVVFLSQAPDLATNDANGPVEDVFAESPGVASVPPPALSNCKTIPTALPTAGGAVTISVDATSSINLSFVSATITPPNAAAVSVALPHSFSNTYCGTYNAPGNSTGDPQIYQVSVTAQDVQGQRSTMTCDPFTVAPQSVGPSVTGCALTPGSIPVTGGILTITASVTSGAGLRSTTASVSFSGATLPAVKLTHTTGDSYRGTASIPRNLTSGDRTIQVEVHATDNNGVDALPSRCSVIQAAYPPPTISNCTLTPGMLPAEGGTLTLSATPTAAAGVLSVTADVSAVGDSVSMLPLSPGPGGVYRATVVMHPNERQITRTITVVVTVTDATRRTARSNPCTAIQDFFPPPSVSSFTATPDHIAAGGGTLTLNATITPGAGISRVTVDFIVPGGTPASALLLHTSGNNYRGTWSVPSNRSAAARTITIQLAATDRESQTASASRTISQDTPPPPKISNCQLSPSPAPYTGGTLTLTAAVTGPESIIGVEAFVDLEGASLTATLRQVAGAKYQGTVALPPNPTAKDRPVRVTIIATDDLHHEDAANCSVTQLAVPPPRISNCKVTPSILPRSGGTLSLSANVTPLTGISTVTAQVRVGSTELPAVTLIRTGIAPYKGTVKIGENLSAGPRQITIKISATDTLGHVGTGNCPSVRQTGSAPPVH